MYESSKKCYQKGLEYAELREQQGERRAGMTEIERYELICRTEAPYPLNYLPSSKESQYRMMGILLGMMIDKGYFRAKEHP
jgi:hypothetical protein